MFVMHWIIFFQNSNDSYNKGLIPNVTVGWEIEDGDRRKVRWSHNGGGSDPMRLVSL